MSDVLRLSDVSYVRGQRAILDGIEWRVRADERWVILGPNGAGKTTLLRLASANDYPSSGSVDVLGQRLGRVDVRELRNRIGLVSNATARRFAASETVRDLVLTAAYGVEGRWRESYDQLDAQRAEQMLADWRLGELAQHPFGTLSDGERKRAMIARAVMADPELLLLDEPSSSLDFGARESLLRVLAQFAISPFAPAMVMVTHHVEEIPPGFTHALLLRAGRVQAAGPIAECLTAANLRAVFEVDVELRVANGRYAAVAQP